VTPEEAVRDVQALGFNVDEERRILHDNATALFGLNAGAVPLGPTNKH
jgi:predicted TIM-barrel fold metal-dependent hydrolase